VRVVVLEMSRKRFTPEQIIGKLREAEVALASRSTNLSLEVRFYFP
jgi:hypothetical protein